MATPDQQAMWDALRILGFDLEDATPDHSLAGMGEEWLREAFLIDVREARRDHDEALEHVCLHSECGVSDGDR